MNQHKTLANKLEIGILQNNKNTFGCGSDVLPEDCVGGSNMWVLQNLELVARKRYALAPRRAEEEPEGTNKKGTRRKKWNNEKSVKEEKGWVLMFSFVAGHKFGRTDIPIIMAVKGSSSVCVCVCGGVLVVVLCVLYAN